MAHIFSLKNSKFFSGLKKICAIVPPITTIILLRIIKVTCLLKITFNVTKSANPVVKPQSVVSILGLYN